MFQLIFPWPKRLRICVLMDSNSSGCVCLPTESRVFLNEIRMSWSHSLSSADLNTSGSFHESVLLFGVKTFLTSSLWSLLFEVYDRLTRQSVDNWFNHLLDVINSFGTNTSIRVPRVLMCLISKDHSVSTTQRIVSRCCSHLRGNSCFHWGSFYSIKLLHSCLHR